MLINRKLIKIVGVIFLVLIISIFIFVFAYFSALEEEIMSFVSRYGYASIFSTSFLTDFFMQPIGPDIPLVAGIVAKLNIVLVFCMTWSGSTLASIVSYRLGRFYGAYGFKQVYGEMKYKKWHRFYQRHGRFTLFLAALTPVPYVPFCWISGIFKMSKNNFLMYGILPRAVRLVGVTYLTLLILGLWSKMPPQILKVISAAVTIVVIINFVLLVFHKISPRVFWSIVILSGVFAYKGLPYLRKCESRGVIIYMRKGTVKRSWLWDIAVFCLILPYIF